jgi:hypothetical protein
MKILDRDLNAIARQLMDLPPQFALEDSETATLHDRVDKGNARFVSFFPGMKNLVVRYYIGGASRNLGITKSGIDGFSTACRFADMVQWHFWKYRIRSCHPPTEADLNLSVARVESDTANEEGWMFLIGAIERHLENIGAILPADVLEEKRKKDRSAASTQRTRHFEFAAHCASVNETLEKLIARMSALEAKIK